MGIKQRLLCRIGESLSYHTKPGMGEQIAAWRERGARIGERLVIYESSFDPLYPQLVTIGDDCIVTGATIWTHDDSLILSKRAAVPRPSRSAIGCSSAAGRSYCRV